MVLIHDSQTEIMIQWDDDAWSVVVNGAIEQQAVALRVSMR
jgi:hypothetical protein